MNQYSLTNATSVFEKHYHLQFEKIKNNNDILNYNNHKVRHTYAVLFVAQQIMWNEKEIFDNKEKIKKWEIASLLHDIARFYQNNGERILDNKEFEHGDIWYEILKNEWYTDLSILFWVKYHNKLNIDWLYKEYDFKKCSETEQKEIIDIANLVRDADKIQNLEYILFDPYNELFILNKNEKWKFTQINLDDFLNWKVTKYIYKNTAIDRIINLASWIFDLNFSYSKKRLKQSNFEKFITKRLKELELDKKIIKQIEDRMVLEFNKL